MTIRRASLGFVAWLAAFTLLAAGCARNPSGAQQRVRIGSKSFTESVVLGEILAQLVQSGGASAEHRRQLGGTQVLWSALTNGDIDVYPEYTGTIREEILSGQSIADVDAMRHALEASGVRMSQPLGFNNTYAIGMRADVADRLGIRTISDLARHPELNLGFSNEVMDRPDGWPGLRDRYELPHQPRGLDHDLAYRAVASGGIDATDLYSTDAEIEYYQLRVLEDDRGFFPNYDAVLLYRVDLERAAPEIVRAIRRLEGKIDEPAMIQMNARAKLERVPETRVAADWVRQQFAIATVDREERATNRFIRHTLEHLFLVGVSLSAAVLIAVPLGVIASRWTRFGQLILAITGLIQTVPSLALLVFMIPLLGIGSTPAIVALFLYSLLPIVRNTYTGLHDISPQVRESAEALGLPPWARLRLIELPMASRAILAGIKTSAVINVGTATLGALIGAGGYGQPILTGIRLDDVRLILEGAVPAAALALVAQGLFELAERALVPKGLRLKIKR